MPERLPEPSSVDCAPLGELIETIRGRAGAATGDEQAWLQSWLTKAEYQLRTRCAEVTASPSPRWSTTRKVVAGLCAAGLLVGIAIWLRPAHHTAAPGRDVPATSAPRRLTPQDNPLAGDGPTAPKVSGSYAGSVAVVADPAGHACCVKPGTVWKVLQRRNAETGQITVAFNNVFPDVTLEAPLPDTGAPFSASELGTVADVTNVQIDLSGTVTPEGGLHASLVVGANGALPHGKAIVFQVDMTKAPRFSVTPV
jgi:hypothetical protein